MKSSLYAMPLMIALFAFGCKDKKDQTPEFGKTAADAEKPTAAATVAGKRWVWSSDGVMLREEPNTTSKSLALIPRGEEVEILAAAAAPPVAANIGGEAGHWVKATLKGKVGWVFDVFLSSPPPADALEYGTPYKLKASEFSDEQFFNFNRDGSVKYARNVCEGFEKNQDKFTVQKGQVYFKGSAMKLEIHGHTNLLMTSGAEEFTCNNVTGAAQFEIPPKR